MLEHYCRDLNGWPRSWMGWKKICRRASNWSPGSVLSWSIWPRRICRPKTIQKHVDNMWALGGEFIRDLNETPSLREKTMERLLIDVINEEGGPLIYNCDSEEEQRSFDATCRKLHRYLTQPQP